MLFAYRTAEHESTKKTPFFLVYGRSARLPNKLDIPSGPDTDSVDLALENRCKTFVQISLYREEAKDNINIAQRKQKPHYDTQVKRVDFKVADNVLMHNARKTTRKGGKLDACWTGPYIIKSVNNN